MTDELQIQKVAVVVNSPINFNDASAKAFYAVLNHALSRGHQVHCTIKRVGTALDKRTLAETGKTPEGFPMFGIGPETILQVTLEMEVDLPMPPKMEPKTERVSYPGVEGVRFHKESA